MFLTSTYVWIIVTQCQIPFRYCIVLYCIVLHCIMRPYTDGSIGPLSYRHSSGVVRIPHSALAEWGIFNLRSISGDPYFNFAPTHFHHQCSCFHVMNDMLECYLWASNHQPFDYWRAHRVYNVASQPRTSDRLACHWRALCLLAYDNWRCSIQPENFHSLKVPSQSRDSISNRQRESPVPRVYQQSII